jgi:hypothetical protein
MRAKFIYEKFVEDSDPISDMNIGISHLIDKNLFKKIREIDTKKKFYYKVADKKIPLDDDILRNVQIIYNYLLTTPTTYISFKYWLEEYYDYYDNKRVDRVKYSYYLLEQIGISECFNSHMTLNSYGEKTSDHYSCIYVQLPVKDKYVEFFEKIQHLEY